MARGLDHIVHAVRDLDAAAALYERLGFVVGARNRHPWGTHNRAIQLPGFFYIELLMVAEPEKLTAAGLPLLFGAFQRDFVSRHEGYAMLLLESRDAAQDAAEFRAAGIAISDALRFEREAKRPDGSEVTLGFALAFARDAAAPDIGFAACQHLAPQNFWNPAFQAHPNSVTSIAGVVLVAENPADHHVFLKAFSGVSDLKSTSSGITIETPRGEIQVMDPSAYKAHFAVEPPDVSRGARLAALRFAVRDMDALRSALETGGVGNVGHMGKRVVPPQDAFGATLAFEIAAIR